MSKISKGERESLFWGKLLEPIIVGEIPRREQFAYLVDLSLKEQRFPDGNIKKPSLSTLQRKLRAFEEGGMQALIRKARNDRGNCRAVTKEVLDRAIAIKKDQPRRSAEVVNHILEKELCTTIPASTMYRHFTNAGVTRRLLGINKQKVRGRWTCDETGTMWIADFEEGPYVYIDGNIFPTHLSAFMDKHSRYIVEGRFYLKQNLDVLIDSLLRAWAIHGSPRNLYLDNAKVYHSDGLQIACYETNTKLIYRRPGDPAGGGAIERFFKTVQDNFEAEVRAGDPISLDDLNQKFQAWLSVIYHERIHSETGQSPKERYADGLTMPVRKVNINRAMRWFMKKIDRTVHLDFSDIQLANKFYRVNDRFRGNKVIVRYDPYGDMKSVLVYSKDDVYLCEAVLHERKTTKEPPTENNHHQKAEIDYLEQILHIHRQRRTQNYKGIDYRKVMETDRWPFSAFVNIIAEYCGRKGGICAFSAGEIEVLKKFHQSHLPLNEIHVKQAFESSPGKTVSEVIYHIKQQLIV